VYWLVFLFENLICSTNDCFEILFLWSVVRFVEDFRFGKSPFCETAIRVYATSFAGIAYSTIPTPIGGSDAKNVKNFLVF
jgi:hypothetical protein